MRRRLLMVGYWAEYCDDERLRADAIAARYGIQDEITVTGALPATAVPAQLLNMRVFALTSKFEGMSNALLEALAVGTPVVTTTVAGFEEHAVAGEHLLRVDSADAPALARAFDAVLRDEALARRLSHGARALAAHYSLDAERRRWFDLYGQLMAARAQPAR
ncbi:MAG: glycosyltransferase [Caldilineaceae bacterium]